MPSKDENKLGEIRLDDPEGQLEFDTFTAFIAEFHISDEDGDDINFEAEPEKFLRAIPRHFRTPNCWPKLVED